MSKLKYLTKISLLKNVCTKWFIGANIVLFVAIISLVNIDSIVKFFGGSFDETTRIYVLDETKESYDEFETYYLEYGKMLGDINSAEVVLYDGTIDEAKIALIDTDDILVVIRKDEANYIQASLMVDSTVDTIIYQVISASLNSVREKIVLDKYEITDEMVADINKAVVIDKIILDNEASSEGMLEMILNVIFPVLILPFFMLTMFLVQMIGASINEEKTTRGMEIIISNVSPTVHFFSKLISGNIFVLGQGLLLGVYLGIALLVRYFVGGGNLLGNVTGNGSVVTVINGLYTTGFMDRLVYLIPVSLVFMILTFVAYSLVAAVLASMTTSIEDYQQVQTPIIIVSVIGYYLAILASAFQGSVFIRVVSYVPFISALLVPSLLALGQIGIGDIVISLVLLLGTIFLLFKYGIRVYKVGILNYSSTGLWSKMFRALKRK